jgi:fumarate reductase (CoM/CoB) subunit A
MDYRTVETDVLIIGAGASGLSAAVYAGESGANVLVVDKGIVGRSGSTVGAVQMTGAGRWSSDDDSAEAFFEDTLDSGRDLSDPELVNILVDEAEQRITDLVEWGLKLDYDDQGKVKVYDTPGHSHFRGISARKGNTGAGIMQILIRKANQISTITRWSDVITVELLTSDGKVTGACVYDLVKNEFIQIKSKAVVLATGSIGRMYPSTSNPVQATGDGFALALKAGAPLVEMEQVQFYPVSLAFPESVKGFCISFYHEAKLYTRAGERFMSRYEPERMENVTRDLLSQAIASELHLGNGTEHNAVLLDARHCIDMVKSDYPHEYQMCLEKGINLETDFAEVAPAAHFMLGGVLIDKEGASGLPGLYVAGESTGGLHGGNRLVNNAVTECLVFGAKAGWAAARYSKQTSEHDASGMNQMDLILEHWKGIFNSQSGTYRPYQIKDRIQAILGDYAGVRRDGEGLNKAQEALAVTEQWLTDALVIGVGKPLSRDVLDVIEASHMIWTAKAIVGSAIQRKESRGAHYRVDFPESGAAIEHTKVECKQGTLEFKKTASLRG